MKNPPTIIGTVMESRWMRNAARRRIATVLLVLLLGILCIWPEHYAAEAELMPQDNGGGLSGVLAEQASGAILNLGALAGNKPSIEADLTIARSHEVMAKTIARLNLTKRPGWGDARHAEVKLKKKVGVIAIRGSILQVTTHDRDPEFAKALAGAVAQSIQDRLAEVSLQQARNKREVALNRLAEATTRLANAQAALNQFRIANRLPAPEQQLGAGVGILAGLQSQLQAKEVQLRSLEQVATPDNIQIRVLQGEIASLRQQVAQAQNQGQGSGGPGLAGIAVVNTQYYNLYRDEKTAEVLYQVYNRYLEELTIDEMSANEAMYVIQPAYLNPNRQFNVWAVGLLLLVVMVAVGAEYYYFKPFTITPVRTRTP